MGDEPHFGFGFAVELGGEVFRGMDLKAEVLASVEDFHEKRETRGGMGGEGLAEDVGAVLGPEIVQREADERFGSTGEWLVTSTNDDDVDGPVDRPHSRI